jgi:hypothetical protein
MSDCLFRLAGDSAQLTCFAGDHHRPGALSRNVFTAPRTGSRWDEPPAGGRDDRSSIPGGFLGVIDHEDLYPRFRGRQFEAELVLNGPNDRVGHVSRVAAAIAG